MPDTPYAHYLKTVLTEVQAALAQATTDTGEKLFAAVKVAASNVENPPVDYESNIVMQPFLNDPVEGDGQDDWPGDIKSSPWMNRYVGGFSAECIRRGDDLLSLLDRVGQAQDVLETWQPLSDLVAELTCHGIEPFQAASSTKPFVMLVLVFTFKYSSGRGQSSARAV